MFSLSSLLNYGIGTYRHIFLNEHEVCMCILVAFYLCVGYALLWKQWSIMRIITKVTSSLIIEIESLPDSISLSRLDWIVSTPRALPFSTSQCWEYKCAFASSNMGPGFEPRASCFHSRFLTVWTFLLVSEWNEELPSFPKLYSNLEIFLQTYYHL